MIPRQSLHFGARIQLASPKRRPSGPVSNRASPRFQESDPEGWDKGQRFALQTGPAAGRRLALAHRSLGFPCPTRFHNAIHLPPLVQSAPPTIKMGSDFGDQLELLCNRIVDDMKRSVSPVLGKRADKQHMPRLSEIEDDGSLANVDHLGRRCHGLRGRDFAKREGRNSDSKKPDCPSK